MAALGFHQGCLVSATLGCALTTAHHDHEQPRWSTAMPPEFPPEPHGTGRLPTSEAEPWVQKPKLKGINVLLSPTIGALGRTATAGRNWEGFSNDPYLCGAMGAPTVTGLQENVLAVAKHYIANEQETNRIPSSYGLGNESVSSNLDDRTIHELYLGPFQDLVKAGVGSVMCSYQRVNNSHACQNSKLLNSLLKTELGFQGIAVSDWDALYTGIAGANAGLDLAMGTVPSPYWTGNLTKAVAKGTLAQSRLDDMATRIVATWYRFGNFSSPGMGLPANLLSAHQEQTVSGMLASSKSTIFQGAVEGHVLVRTSTARCRSSLPRSCPCEATTAQHPHACILGVERVMGVYVWVRKHGCGRGLCVRLLPPRGDDPATSGHERHHHIRGRFEFSHAALHLGSLRRFPGAGL